MISIFYCLFFVFTHLAQASGAWYQNFSQVPYPLNPDFDPEFIILKAGIYSKEGALKWVLDQKDSKNLCSSKREAYAWVTHRLSGNESLSVEAGTKLGANLKKALANTCFKGIEIDMEPLDAKSAWLPGFLKALKSSLDPALRLHLAIPALSAHKIPGSYWDLSSGVAILEIIDGLDVMLYDTGLASSKDYGALFKNAFFFAMELVKLGPEKKITLGLPTYKDKTKLHQLNAENLSPIVETLKPFTPFQLKHYCLGNVRFSYYAGWTLDKTDLTNHRMIKDWKSQVCKKDS